MASTRPAAKRARAGAQQSTQPGRGAKPTNQSTIEAVANSILAQLRDGTSPIVQRWETAPPIPPHNPISGVQYRGINSLTLAGLGYADPRWMTFKQAIDKGWQVAKGARAAPIVYWQTTKIEKQVDPTGQPIRDASGKPLTRTVRLSRPRLFRARVFNASQIKGIAPFEPERHPLPRIERADALIAASNAQIFHDQADRAFYDRRRDEIHLPAKDAFRGAGIYYATALHELGHWTGHESRLDRTFGKVMGSPEYAREELRAEIYSYMMAAELRLPHDPGEHINYVGDWIRALENEPAEILRATRDAQAIQDYVRTLEQTPMHSIGQLETPMPKRSTHTTPGQLRRSSTESATEARPAVASPRTSGRPPARASIQHTDLLKRENVPITEIQIREQFAGFLYRMGLELPPGQGHPIMDGQKHRVPVRREDGKRNTAGMYVGYLDGWPAGHATNHVSGEQQNWKADIQLKQSDIRHLAQQASQHRQVAAQAMQRSRDHVARRAALYVSLLPKAPDAHQYLKTKGITADPDLKVNRRGDLILPLRDQQGQVRSFQRIRPNGFKGLKKGGAKAGNFYLIDPDKKAGSADIMLLAEGYSTGRTVNMLTGLPVVVVVDSNNLAPAARSVQAAYPKAALIIAGDDDRHLKAPAVNAGRVKALAAAETVDGEAVFPSFGDAPPDRTATDWNDLATRVGLTSAGEQLKQKIDKARTTIAARVQARTRGAGRGR